MKNTKIISIVSIIVAVILPIFCFIFNFNKTADLGTGYKYTVQFNSASDEDTILSVMKEAGAKNVYFVKQLDSTGFEDEYTIIYFNASSSEEAQQIFDKAEEAFSNKYFLKTPANFSAVAETANQRSFVGYWTALLVFVLAVVYTYIRFGCTFGTIALAAPFEVAAAFFGLVALIGLPYNGFTVAVLMGAGVLQLFLVLLYANLAKSVEKKLESKEAVFAYAGKKLKLVTLVTVAVAAAAFILLAILGNTIIKAFAIESLVAIALVLVVSLFVCPAFTVFLSKKN